MQIADSEAEDGPTEMFCSVIVTPQMPVNPRLPEDGVLAVQVGCGYEGDEELAAVRVRACAATTRSLTLASGDIDPG